MPCQTPYRGDTSQMLLFKIASCLADGSFISGVSSFNSRTGAVTLTSGDVITALGFTPISESDGDARYVLKSGDTMTGALTIGNGVLVASEPALSLNQTWNNAAVTFTGLLSNVTNTASAADSNLFNFQTDGIDRFRFASIGQLFATRQDATNSGVTFFQRKRGSLAGATAAVAADATIGSLTHSGWDGTAYANGSRISGLANQTWTNVAHGSRIDLYTTPDGSTSEQITLRLAATGQALFTNGTAALPSLSFQTDLDTGIYRIGANILGVSTTGVERIQVDAAGMVGIGATPSRRLHVSGAAGDQTIRINAPTGMYPAIEWTENDSTAAGDYWQLYKDPTSNNLIFWNNGEHVALTNLGRVGIGTVSPGTKLHVSGVDADPIFLVNGTTKGIRFTFVAGSSLLEGVDSTGFGSFQPLFIQGSTLVFGNSGVTMVSIIDPDVTLAVGKRLGFTSGANQRAGNATLVAGTVTVANTSVTANTIVLLTRKTAGGTVGTVITYTVTAATSFTINSDSALDTSTFSYLLIEVP